MAEVMLWANIKFAFFVMGVSTPSTCNSEDLLLDDMKMVETNPPLSRLKCLPTVVSN